MEIREALICDVNDLQELYLKHLINNSPLEPQINEEWSKLIEKFSNDEDYHLIVGVVDGKIVCSVTLIVIRNLTHNLRPYSVMENVVTHSDYRCKGYASSLIEYASNIAGIKNCYKIMLMTGSKRESTLNFYKQNGFSINDKTACLKRL
jgi:N-acetylglutamate synthase-like GNAT family acetyltransferase